jgi:hypothetical protein
LALYGKKRVMLYFDSEWNQIAGNGTICDYEWCFEWSYAHTLNSPSPQKKTKSHSLVV